MAGAVLLACPDRCGVCPDLRASLVGVLGAPVDCLPAAGEGAIIDSSCRCAVSGLVLLRDPCRRGGVVLVGVGGKE